MHYHFLSIIVFVTLAKWKCRLSEDMGIFFQFTSFSKFSNRLLIQFQNCFAFWKIQSKRQSLKLQRINLMRCCKEASWRVRLCMDLKELLFFPSTNISTCLSQDQCIFDDGKAFSSFAPVNNVCVSKSQIKEQFFYSWM